MAGLSARGLRARVLLVCALAAGSGCQDRGVTSAPTSARGRNLDALRPPVDTVADLFLGQISASQSQVNLTDGRGIYWAESVAIDATNDRLYVADTQNNRVLAWASASAFANGETAALVIGQANANGHLCNLGLSAPTSSTLCTPEGVTVDSSGNLWVTDTGNNRVLRFNTPFTTDLLADQVFGQASYASSSCNGGAALANATTLCTPSGTALDSAGALYISDRNNHRVLKFNAPLSDTTADVVLGQSTMAARAPDHVDLKGLHTPVKAVVDRVNNRVYVSDSVNNRVLGWPNATSFSNGEAATVLLGQADAASTLCNRGGAAAADTFCDPRGVGVDASGNVYVADDSNDRVLVFLNPFTNDGVADKVYGQTNFTNTGCNATSTGLCSPDAVTISPAGDVYVADASHHRVLRFNGGYAGDTTADQVFGQNGSFTSSTSNNGGRSATSLYFPRGISFDSTGRMYVSDASNNRVLGFNTAPSFDATADIVFGQSGSFTTGGSGTSAITFDEPYDVSVDGLGNLWVADYDNYRLLGFSNPASDQTADVVLGQPSMTGSCSSVSATCTDESNATGVATDAAGNVFYVDSDNDRVLRFVTPFSTDTSADQVLGQGEMSRSSSDMADAYGFDSPRGIAIDTASSPNRIYLADSDNNRVLGWATNAVTTDQPADRVFGKSNNFFGTGESTGSSGLDFPTAVAVAAGNLYIADTDNSRVTEYDVPYPAGNSTADRVLGQPTVSTGDECNQGTSLSAGTLCYPIGLAVDASQNVWVSDTENHRVLRYITPWTTDRNADSELGQLGFVQDGPNRVEAGGVNQPSGVVIDRTVSPNRIYVVDTANSRVLGWPDVTAFTNGQAATLVIGQADLNASGCNEPTLGPASLCDPRNAAIDAAGRLYVSDRGNNRVLIYALPFTTDAVADKVIGQPDYTSVASNQGLPCGANTLDAPAGLTVDPAGNLWVADEYNNRALQYASAWTGDAVADAVIGQADFTSCNWNRTGGGTAANGLDGPVDVAWDATAAPPRLYVVDSWNNRAVAFNDPTVDGTADQVFGQSSFTGSSCFSGSTTHPCAPQGGAVDLLGNFYLSDWDGHRVFEYDAPRTTDNTIDVYYGQSSPSGDLCNQGNAIPTASTVCFPGAIAFDANNNLYLVDVGNNRVSLFLSNNRPTATPLNLTPASPDTSATLTASYSYADLDGDLESGSVLTWYKDGVAQGLAGTTVAPALTSRGEGWHFTVRPRDGLEFGPLATSPTVVIINSVPVATAPIVNPAPARTADDLVATWNYLDADGDTQSGSTIRWYRNSVLQSAYNDLATVPNAATAKGELWYFTVAPSDGTATGAAVQASTIAIANTAPAASSLSIAPASPASGSQLTGNYAFADADGDLEAGSVIRWYRNGLVVAAYNDVKIVPAGVVVAGESWYFTTQPRDGLDLGALMTSPTALIGSSAPVASNVNITPASPTALTALQRNYTFSDPDVGHTESGSQTRWYRNGALQAAYNDLATIPTSQLVRGNTWYFTITPRCSSALNGALQTSPTVTIGNSPPSATVVALAPASPLTTQNLTASWTYGDPDGDAQGAAVVRWYRNGAEQTGLANLTTVNASFTTRGENWYFTVQPFDGTVLGALQTSNTVTIVNSAPTASALILLPASPRATDTLSASWTFSDPDGDPQVGTEVRWYENGVEDVTLFNANSVPPSKLVKGRAWYFRVTPRDNIVFGTQVQSATVTVINSAPVATALAIVPASPPAGASISATYNYADADGDAQGASELRWYRNGVEQLAYAGMVSVPAGVTAKGQQWYFTVRPNDGSTFGSPAQSPTVTIANQAPVAQSPAISPTQPRSDDPLTATYTYVDGDGDPEGASEIRWYRNAVEVPALAGLTVVPAVQTTRGEAWYFTVRPSDGTELGTLVTASPVVILNTAPVASNVNIAPLSPKTTDAITATYTFTDADGDLQQGSEVRWYRNGVELVAYFNQTTLPAGVAVANDTVYFTVRPRDGVSFGTLVTSTQVVVGSSAPVATALQVTPLLPRFGDALVASYLYSDPDGQAEGVSEIKWYRNAVEQVPLANLRTVPAGTARKGEVWRFTVRPYDGAAYGAMQTSPTVTVQNTAPVATNTNVAPAAPGTDDLLQAVYTFADVDQDGEAASEIRWYKNGLEQAALLNQTQVPAALTRKNEVWYYRVRPYDGVDYGAAENSTPAFIANSPPLANAGVDQALTPTAARVRVTLDGRATTDADGDVLAYSWAEGATVLGTGSTLAVDLPLGPHTIELMVSDGDGSSTDTVLIDIANPKPTATVPAAFSVAPSLVRLVGSGAENLGRTLTYAWTQLSGDPVTLQNATSATATFLATTAGPRTIRLVVSADGTPSDPADVTVTVLNVAPNAAVLPRRVVAANAAARLDGVGSGDANGDAVSYLWALDAAGNTAGAFADPALPAVDFTPLTDGRYLVQLVVNDGTQDSAPSLGELLAIDPSVAQHVPVANAGTDGVGEVGRTVLLDGRLSYDIDAEPLSFVWRRLSGPAGELGKANSSQATFRPTAPGTLVLGLTVSDAAASSVEDTVTIEVTDAAVNGRPQARAQGEATAAVGVAVPLDGTRSTDPDGDPLTYAWSQVDGVSVVVDDPAAARPTFSATQPGLVRLRLVVSDGTLASQPAVVAVQITSGTNRPPAAYAGPDQALLAGSAVQLDGAASADPDGDALTFVWEQLEGPPVVLTGAAATPGFTPPGLGRYRFRLVVRDGEVPSLPDEVEVKVSTHGADNQPPVASAGTDQDVALNANVSLDGTASFDPDPFDRLTYLWTFVAYPTGLEPALDNSAAVQPSFGASVAGSYTLKLQVSDGDLVSAPAYVTVVVLPPGVAAGCSCGSGAGFGGVLGLAWVLALLGRRRRGGLALVLAAAVAVGATEARAAAKAKPAAGQKKKAAPAKVEEAAPVTPEVAAEAAAAPAAEPVAAPAGGSGVANPYLEEARQMYANFQLEGLITKLEFALAVKGINEDQKVEIFKLMAFTHASFDDDQKAQEAFLRLLEVRPKYELSGASPKIRQYFVASQKQFRERQAVKLAHSPPKASGTGATTTVDVVAVAGADRVSVMTLHFRAEGERAFSQTQMQAGENGAFSAAVPNIFPGPAGRRKVEYFVRARDKGGALLAGVGEESQPMLVEVEAVEAAAKATPVYKSGWFWVIGGVVVAGVAASIATPLILRKDAAPPAGSLGVEQLP